MTPAKSQSWEPIEDLPITWIELDDPSVTALVAAWRERVKELENSDSYRDFTKRLLRQIAIETGAIEDIYRISEGATRVLIAQGLDSALISHDDVSESPPTVIARILDQHDAIEGLYQFVSSQRELSTSYIRELHQVVTRNQDTFPARDLLGNPVTRTMIRGEWKKFPNNVEGPDGFKFEFCPPVQVDSEMDRFLRLHAQHVEDQIPATVEAAWLHHRFSLIHPFVDGNGRIARCLATLVLLKDGYFPLVVTRGDKPTYINALRRADDGDLKGLVDFFGTLQKRTIREALSLADDTIREVKEIRGILESAKAAFIRKHDEQNELVKRSFEVADKLQIEALGRLESLATEIIDSLQSIDHKFEAFALGASRHDLKADYYRYQIVQCARQLGYYANALVYRSWAVLGLIGDVRTEILFSFHAIGHGSSGVMGCTGMIYGKREGDQGGEDKKLIGEITPLSSEPFEFTYKEDFENVFRRFRKWLEECLVAGLTRWKNDAV